MCADLQIQRRQKVSKHSFCRFSVVIACSQATYLNVSKFILQSVTKVADTLV